MLATNVYPDYKKDIQQDEMKGFGFLKNIYETHRDRDDKS